ncbi:MAG: XylR family transcriptional regulator [Kiritimatiellae bacterium]|nr:XylR family transcriptional regulator [Kiritimatiellia bacterium]
MKRPKRAVKRQARKKMPQVAVLLETSHGISRMELRGILKYVRVYGPWSIHNNVGGTSDLKMPDKLHWRGNGIIGRVPNDKVARQIADARLPTVLFNPGDKYLSAVHPLSNCCRTESDSAAIGRLAAQLYLAKPFPHFAFVGEATGINWSVRRQNAFAVKLAETGKTCHQYPMPPRSACGWDTERPLLCRWLKRLPKPVSIFAANDYRARQVLDACLVTNISVPYEAAVLGVNNDELICETSIPQLSSIALDAEKAGYEAARMLDALMQRQIKEPQVISYGPSGVIARASTDALHVKDRLVVRALEFIRINNGLTIRVSDVAQHLGVSSRWLEMRFSQTIGRAVNEEIRNARMATVCAMLKETDLPLSAISKRCGFAHPNHLCTLFKSEHGMTMGDYRRQTSN